MEKEIVEEIMRECKISKRKAEEMFKASLFYGDSYSEAKENIKEFLNISLLPFCYPSKNF